MTVTDRNSSVSEVGATVENEKRDGRYTFIKKCCKDGGSIPGIRETERRRNNTHRKPQKSWEG